MGLASKGVDPRLLKGYGHVMRNDGGAGSGQVRRTSHAFPAELASAGWARNFVAGVCRDWALPDVVADAEIVTTELVENAVRHSRSACEVTLELAGDVLKIGVGDRGTWPPRVLYPGPDQPGGRGMLLVESISQHWGFDRTDGGKIVWAELAANRSTVR